MPGPPVRIDRRCPQAWRTASHCSPVSSSGRSVGDGEQRLGVEQLHDPPGQRALQPVERRLDDAPAVEDEPSRGARAAPIRSATSAPSSRRARSSSSGRGR